MCTNFFFRLERDLLPRSVMYIYARIIRQYLLNLHWWSWLRVYGVQAARTSCRIPDSHIPILATSNKAIPRGAILSRWDRFRVSIKGNSTSAWGDIKNHHWSIIASRQNCAIHWIYTDWIDVTRVALHCGDSPTLFKGCNSIKRFILRLISSTWSYV